MTPGNYYAKLKTGIFTKAKTTPTMSMALVFDVTHEAREGQWAPLDSPAERTVYLHFTPKAQQYTDSKLMALGFNGDFNTPDFSDESKFEGIELICKHETDSTNKTQERWDMAKWGGDRTIEPAPADAARQAAAAWKARTAATQKPAGRPAAPPAAPARTGPPPASTPPAGAMDESSAWAVVENAWLANNDEEKRNEAWRDAIAKIGRPAKSFTPADWQKVADSASLPF